MQLLTLLRLILLMHLISWNKYFSKPELLEQNPNLNYLVKPSFQGVNRPFVLAIENDLPIIFQM